MELGTFLPFFDIYYTNKSHIYICIVCKICKEHVTSYTSINFFLEYIFKNFALKQNCIIFGHILYPDVTQNELVGLFFYYANLYHNFYVDDMNHNSVIAHDILILIYEQVV